MPALRRVAWTALALMVLLAATPAAAFFPPIHQAAFRAVLADRFDARAQRWVELGLEGPDALVGQTHPEYHFDSAPDRDAVCRRWEEGPGTFLHDITEYAYEAFRPKPPGEAATFDRLATNRELGLARFGYYVHAIQDFYSHSNWIEIFADRGEPAPLAPIVSGCDPAVLPVDLSTGYFDLDYGISGCPSAGPPEGFRYCHGPTADPGHQLAKDVPSYHGADRLPDGSATYHEEAVRLATLATADAWTVLHDRVVAELRASLPDRSPECLFTSLVMGGDPSCPVQRRELPGHTPLPSTDKGWGTVGILGISTTYPPTWSVRSFDADVTLDPAGPVNRTLSVELFAETFAEAEDYNDYLYAFEGATSTPRLVRRHCGHGGVHRHPGLDQRAAWRRPAQREGLVRTPRHGARRPGTLGAVSCEWPRPPSRGTAAGVSRLPARGPGDGSDRDDPERLWPAGLMNPPSGHRGRPWRQ